MTQLFSPLADFVVRLVFVVVVATVILLAVGAWAWWRSPYADGTGIIVDQPVPFSHEHHVSGLGLDCRYCHLSVENSSFAGMPTSYTCMTCHSQLWDESEMLRPVRESLARNEPLRWQRVHNLADFAFFDHRVHVSNGVGCTSCHGDIGEMPLTMKAHSMSMSWCLDCHRNPSPHLEPSDRIFAASAQSTDSEPHPELMAAYDIDEPSRLVQCSICHR